MNTLLYTGLEPLGRNRLRLRLRLRLLGAEEDISI
jgi:hypothetical protein